MTGWEKEKPEAADGKKPAGFEKKVGGLCHQTRRALKKVGGLWHRTRRALKKRRRALPSNTAGFEKKSAGFGIEHGGL
ncbi:hypothetical protein M1B74_11485 [Bacteroides pyogenes]|uniref:hypothetical protein n=1 Tax=Bacteroides pyogenes TaxID=310300 RepID=UPI003B43B345